MSSYKEPVKGSQNIVVDIIVLGAFRAFRITLRFDEFKKTLLRFHFFLGFLSHDLYCNLGNSRNM